MHAAGVRGGAGGPLNLGGVSVGKKGSRVVMGGVCLTACWCWWGGGVCAGEGLPYCMLVLWGGLSYCMLMVGGGRAGGGSAVLHVGVWGGGRLRGGSFKGGTRKTTDKFLRGKLPLTGEGKWFCSKAKLNKLAREKKTGR